MQLTPREKDKLLVAMAAEVARKRLARGVKLNHPEAIAIITDAVVEDDSAFRRVDFSDNHWIKDEDVGLGISNKKK